MIADNQIREQIARYLENKVSLDSFEDWIAQRSWNMHKDSDPLSQKLASAVELRLAEHSSGHLDEANLRAELVQFVTKYVLSVQFNEFWTIRAESALPNLSSSNTGITVAAYQVTFPGRQIPPVASQFVGTSPAVVYA